MQLRLERCATRCPHKRRTTRCRINLMNNGAAFPIARYDLICNSFVWTGARAHFEGDTSWSGATAERRMTSRAVLGPRGKSQRRKEGITVVVNMILNSIHIQFSYFCSSFLRCAVRGVQRRARGVGVSRNNESETRKLKCSFRAEEFAFCMNYYSTFDGCGRLGSKRIDGGTMEPREENVSIQMLSRTHYEKTRNKAETDKDRFFR